MIPNNLPQGYKELASVIGLYDVAKLNEVINIVYNHFPLNHATDKVSNMLLSYTVKNEGSISTSNEPIY